MLAKTAAARHRPTNACSVCKTSGLCDLQWGVWAVTTLAVMLAGDMTNDSA